MFVKVFDDLATPLAPERQGHAGAAGVSARHLDRHRRSDGLRDRRRADRRFGRWRCGLSAGTRGQRLFDVQRGGGGLAKRSCGRAESVVAYGVVGSILVLVLAPASGASAAVVRDRLVVQPVPDGFTIAHYARVFGESSVYIENTLVYASLAGLIDVVSERPSPISSCAQSSFGREWLDWAASAALAVPGVVLGIGYLRAF